MLIANAIEVEGAESKCGERGLRRLWRSGLGYARL